MDEVDGMAGNEDRGGMQVRLLTTPYQTVGWVLAVTNNPSKNPIPI